MYFAQQRLHTIRVDEVFGLHHPLRVSLLVEKDSHRNPLQRVAAKR